MRSRTADMTEAQLFTHGESFYLSPERPPGMAVVIASVASRLLSVQVSLLFPLMSCKFTLLIAISVPVVTR